MVGEMTPASSEQETEGGKRAIAIIAAFTIARVVVASCIPLASGETYTLAISRRLDLSYFDHPPLHQWIAHFGALAFGESVWARLPVILLFSATGWLVFALTRDLFGPRAGLIALFGLNSSMFFFVGTGFSLIPDGPLVFALAAATSLLVRLLFFEQRDSVGVWRLWLAVGFCLGLAGLAKYTAIFFALGLALFMALSARQRRWFAQPAPYAGAFLCLTALTPVLLWNGRHHWISLLFQLRRAESTDASPMELARIAIVEIAALTPWVFVPLALAITRAIWPERRDERSLFLLCLALPTIVFFNMLPLWGAAPLMHWSMPGWFLAFPLMGAYLDQAWSKDRDLRRWATASTAALGLVAALAISEALTGWMARAVAQIRASPNSTGEPLFDPTLDTTLWTALRDAPLLTGRNGTVPAFVVSFNWKESGIIAVAIGPGIPVLPYRNQRGMAYLNDASQFVGKDGVIVLQESRLATSMERLRPFFESLGEPQRLSRDETGFPRISLILIPAYGLRRPFPMSGMDAP